MTTAMSVFDALPARLQDPVVLTAPFLILLIVLEWIAARKLLTTSAPAADDSRNAPGAHFGPDTIASLSTGLVSLVTGATWKTIAAIGYAAIYTYVAPWHLSPHQWYTWVIAVLGLDLIYCVDHRIAHRVRLIWAAHQPHHSSEYFNLATAVRVEWNKSGEIIMFAILPLLGVPPWVVFFSWSINLTYQFWVHTERIGKLPRWYEYLFNTPSHHRVHHGMDQMYLDKNFGGILIIWDRMLGTFQAEEFRPHYGLTKPVHTFNIWKLQTNEYAAIVRDWRSATRLRDRLGYVFGPPGWKPQTAANQETGRLAKSA